ncbi:hypothetical protein CHS0354_042794 [Potamilus streckersoni]|uniref:E3 ubiquitin-protein ligase ZNRF1 n=1 Tax=Potamilus streckersoni TaxID=2493646 RepID=A0AAE0W6D4_9BIVA|nr:hypothetical protein CHS0354_042794 [Potamilus streckersoni]
MGAKQSTGNHASRVPTFSGSPSGHRGSGPHMSVGGGHGSANTRARARSLGSFAAGTSEGLNIPGSAGGATGTSSPDSDSSPDESSSGPRTFPHSLPLHLFALQGIKCPVCSKFIPPEDLECHLVMCLTKPRISYNEDVLTEDKGECCICLDDLTQGDTIARLPCLCIYHKVCIDSWFKKNRSCPEHPQD